MRRTYISPEFDHNDIYGTFNMVEQSSFFGSKMLEIEDILYIDNQNIIYYQNANGEQIDLSSESTLNSNVYSSSDSKKSYHTLTLDQTQSSYSLDNSTKWILNINLKSILIDFLYAELKRSRTFEGIKNEMTLNNDVSSSLKNYISNNVLNRYKFSKVDIFIKYNDLKANNLLKFNNTWDYLTYNSSNNLSKFQSDLQYDQSSVKISFNQDKPSTLYNFNYYFNILFEKI